MSELAFTITITIFGYTAIGLGIVSIALEELPRLNRPYPWSTILTPAYLLAWPLLLIAVLINAVLAYARAIRTALKGDRA